MYKNLYSKLIFPISYKILNRKIPKYYKHLQRDATLSREEILMNSYSLLKKLLVESYDNVPYYNKTWKEVGFNPIEDFKSLEDMNKIPVLTKEIIQNNKDQLISRKYTHKSLIKNFTGGATGKSLIFFQTKEAKDWGTAEILRHYNMCGWEIGDKHAFLWGSERDSPINNLKTQFLQEIRRYKWFNSFKLSDEKLFDIINILKKFNPKLLIGYASSVFKLANFSEENNLELTLPSVQTSAEKLHDFQRKKIADVFNCQVFNRYGCREVGNIAHECSEHEFLHLSEQTNYIEILNNDGDPVDYGKEGKITVTNLRNFGMPFIRYQNEDWGIMSDKECVCGNHSRFLEPTVGRISDNIKTPKGKIVHGEYFTHLFYNLPQIKQFQLIQETVSEINIKIVRNADYSDFNYDTLFKKMKEDIYQWLDEKEIEINFLIVEDIPATDSGKYHFTISKVV